MVKNLRTESFEVFSERQLASRSPCPVPDLTGARVLSETISLGITGGFYPSTVTLSGPHFSRPPVRALESGMCAKAEETAYRRY